MIDGGYIFAGALTGVVIALTGVGGGALMTPILIFIFAIAPTTAIATDLWFAAITKLLAAAFHTSAGQVDWKIVKRLWMGSLPMALLVALGVNLGVRTHKVDWLTQAVGVLVLVTAIGLIFAPRLSRDARQRRLNFPEKFKLMQPALTVAAGSILGFCVALTSVGAGALGNTLLLYLYPLRMTPHRLIATDIVHAIPLAMLAGFGYLLLGLVDGPLLTSLLVGSLPGVVVGSLLARKLSPRSIQIGLAILLLVVGLKAIV